MMNITVSGSESLERARDMFDVIESGFQDAFKKALQRTTRRVSGRAAAEIRRNYDIYESEVRKNSRSTSVVYSHQLGVRAELTFSGHKIPLHKFGGAAPAYPTQDRSRSRVPVTQYGETGIDGTERWYYPGIAARGHQLAGTAPALFDEAFVAKMPSGHIGIFQRTGGMTEKNNQKIEEIMGGSVAQMLENEAVRTALENEAKRIFEEETDKAVQKAMEGKRK